MPVISRFHGIVIFMNYNDHAPPHFHARHQDEEVIIEIDGPTVTGTMSARPLRLVLDWTYAHQVDLLEDWHLARDRKPLKPIPPLE